MARHVMDNKKWRLLDTGPKTAVRNIALDSALLMARSKNLTQDTLHFLQYRPAALVGYFQSVGQEIREDFCRRRGIEIQRRITGGGALYFDETHLGWEIIALKPDFGILSDEITRRICGGVVAGLARLGVKADFRPRNDIEVAGRKISGTGGVFEGDAMLFQGTLLIDLDVESMIKALRIPTEKLSDKGLESARERVTSLREEMGRLPSMDEVKEAIKAGFESTLGIRFDDGGLTEEEISLSEDYVLQYKDRSWLELVSEPADEHLILRSALKASGGLIRVAASVDTRRRRLKYALITGDFFVNPRRAVLDLEAALKNVPLSSVEEIIHDFFAAGEADMAGLTPADFAAAVSAAVSKMDLARHGISLSDANSVFTINGTFENAVESCSVLLLPYCAKMIDCEFREVDGCDKCGQCSMGAAYEMGEEMGLEVITIHNYEHLRETLWSLRERGAGSYIGCCCEAFFIKHQGTFRDADMPAALIDIEKDTCYQLGSEEEAYGGRFENQTELKLDLLERVLDSVRESHVA
jgi:lipoate-protein ligase A